MKGIRKAILVTLLTLVAVGMTACGSSSPVERSYFAMDTVMTVKVFGEESLLSEVGTLLSDWDNKFSATDRNSLIYALNEQNTPITDPETVEIVTLAKTLAERTEGYFDPTVYPLVKAWGFLTDEPDVPSQSEIETALTTVGYDNIYIENGSVTCLNGAKIDLGAIAKGYASDKLKDYFISKGVKDGLLNLGGNVYAMGKKNGADWKVAIKDPVGEGYLGVLNASDKAIVTSGLYERFFEKEGKKYGHILNPFDGNTVENEFLSVTVIGKNGTECDAFSTALFVMGKEKSLDFIRENHLDVILLTKEDGIYISETISGDFTPSGQYKTEKYTVIQW